MDQGKCFAGGRSLQKLEQTKRIVNKGIARLAVRQDGETSTVFDQYSQAPLQLHRPLYLDGAKFPTVYLKTPSSGLLGGDSHHIDVSVAAGSRLELRTQAATLAYPGTSALEITMTIEDGGSLEFLPHALILGAQSALTQKVKINLQGEASIKYSDTWCAGRIAMLEQWQFESFDLCLEILRDGNLLYRENWRIAPTEIDYLHPLLCGSYTHFASLYCFGPAFAAEEELNLTLPTNSWEAEQSWVLNRNSDRILRRCSKKLMRLPEEP